MARAVALSTPVNVNDYWPKCPRCGLVQTDSSSRPRTIGQGLRHETLECVSCGQHQRLGVGGEQWPEDSL